MFPTRFLDLVQAIHDSPARCCISTTGAGASAVSALMSVGGCSRTLLDARVPYANSALSELLDYIPTKSVCPQVAHDLAHSAYRRAERMCDATHHHHKPHLENVGTSGLGASFDLMLMKQHEQQQLQLQKQVTIDGALVGEVSAQTTSLQPPELMDEKATSFAAAGAADKDPKAESSLLIGLGCTAAIASTRQRRGEDIVYVSCRSATQLTSWSLKMTRGLPRHVQEWMVACVLVSALAESAGVPTPDLVDLCSSHVSDVVLPDFVVCEESIPPMGPSNGTTAPLMSGAGASNANTATTGYSPVVLSVEEAEEAMNTGEGERTPGGTVVNNGGHKRIASGRCRPATLRELVTADLTQRLGKAVYPCVANPLQILLERKDVLTRLVVNRNGDVHFDGTRAAHNPEQPEPFSDAPCCPAQAHYLLYPGSFAPLHYGHMELARVASFVVRRRASGYNPQTGAAATPPKPVFLTFEISSSRVNKRELNENELRRYIDQFTRNGMRVGVSNAMLFIDKARAFPNHAFIVGADTAERVINPTYYLGSYEKMLAALREIEALGCYFVVGGRKIEQTGEWVAPKDIKYPPEMEHLFVPISANDFRVDVSSTEIRARRGSREGLDLME